MARPQNATLNPKSLRRLRIGIVIFLAVHFLAAQIFGFASMVLILLLELVKLGCCLWCFSRLPQLPARFRWLGIAVAVMFGSFSLSILIVRFVFLGKTENLDHVAILAVSLAFAPVLFAVASNFSKQDSPAVRRIDAILCLPLACLYFAQTYWVSNSGPESTLSVVVMNDMRSAFLLACAALQFIAADDEEDRRFFYVYFIGQALTVALEGLHNHLVPGPASLDLLIDLPILAFIWLTLHPTPTWVHGFRPMKHIAHFVRGGNPILMSLALTLLGIAMSRQHFFLGGAGILTGIVGYGLRNAVIHGKLLKTEETLLQAQKDMEVLATHDALSGIPNRRSFDATLGQAWEHTVRTGEVLAVLMIDIDFFKAMNDTYGHQAGDDCLAVVARKIKSMLPRTDDYVARYGGEEFAAILPGTSAVGAQVVADRLRSGILDLAIPNANSIYECITVSIGVAAGSATDTADAHLLLKTADEALYGAKNSGRNRTKCIDRVSPLGSRPDNTIAASYLRKTGTELL